MVRGVLAFRLVTGDFEHSLAFYEAVLGVSHAAITTVDDKRWGFLEMADGTRLVITEGTSPEAVDGMFLEIESKDPDALFARLSGTDVLITRPLGTTDRGSYAFEVQDPDGRRIRIGTRWELPA